MPSIVSLPFTEVGRTRLIVGLGTLNWLCFCASFVLVTSGAYIKLALQKFTNLVDDYNDNTLPFLLLGVGVTSAIFSFSGEALFYFSLDSGKREKLISVYYVYMTIEGLLSIFLVVAGVLCYVHVDHLEEAFHGGLNNAMLKYKKHKEVKVDLDFLQIEYKCCGNKNYTDWFRMDWISEEYKDEYNYGLPKHISGINQ